MTVGRDLSNRAVGAAVEKRSPALQLAQPIGGFLGEQCDHFRVVDSLSRLHRVAKVQLPVVVAVNGSQSRRQPALGHHRWGLAEQRLADHRGPGPPRRGLDGGPQSSSTGADDNHVVVVALDTG